MTISAHRFKCLSSSTFIFIEQLSSKVVFNLLQFSSRPYFFFLFFFPPTIQLPMLGL